MGSRRFEVLRDLRCRRRLLAFLLALPVLCAAAAQAHAGSGADALLARHASMQAQLTSSPMGRPLTVDSEELPGGLRGEVFAEVEQPFAQVVQALARPGNWCDMLLLHVNNRRCRLVKIDGGGGGC